MKNSIKMYLYRAIHSKSSWIILLLAVCMAVFSVYMGKLDGDAYHQEIEKEAVMQEEEMSFGIVVDTPMIEDGKQPAAMEYVVADINSGILLIFLTVFVVLFINGEESSGFIKNIAGQTRRRGVLLEAKMAVICLYNLVLMGLYTLADITGVYLAYSDVKLGMNEKTAAFLGAEYLLMMTFSMFVACITILVRSNVIGMVLGIVDACGFGYLLTNAINRLLDMDKLGINQYTVVGRINGLNVQEGFDAMAKAALVAVAWFVLWLAVSELFFSRRDIQGSA